VRYCDCNRYRYSNRNDSNRYAIANHHPYPDRNRPDRDPDGDSASALYTRAVSQINFAKNRVS
jgi:hypothetical protein